MIAARAVVPDIVEVSTAAMGTVITLQAHGLPRTALEARLRAALAIAHDVEGCCSRFRPDSEVTRLCATHGTPTAVSPLLYGVLEVAQAVAEASDGAFDYTVGARLHARGFAAQWDTGAIAPPPPLQAEQATWRDLVLLEDRQVCLKRPLLLDLGGVAKGFALDLMATALADLPGAALDAGGDLRVVGRHPEGRAWRIGVRDPRSGAPALVTLDIIDGAVCTSGDSQRRDAAGRPHLIDPRSSDDTPAQGAPLRSVTVCAPLAAVADALATAAFVLGADAGGRFLTAHGATGVFIDDAGRMHCTTPAPPLLATPSTPAA